MSDLDTRLLHPRRRASDVGKEQPTLPQLGQIDVTSELLDEIAWRVAEQMRRTQGGAVSPTAPTAPVIVAPLPEPVKPAPPAMPDGAAIVIRLRKPLFSWTFWRRRPRRQSMISLSDYHVT